MKDKPVVAARKPAKVELRKAKDYWFCACGRSVAQPFCDGSHLATSFTPHLFSVEQDGRAFLCACKQTAQPPFCDGTHAALAGESAAEPGAKPAGPVKRKIWLRIAAKDELAEGEAKAAMAGTTQIALTLRHGAYGAIDNACPHQGGPLGEGALDEEGCLVCPWHGWRFDARTGRGPGGINVASYAVEVRDDGLYVEIEDAVAGTATEVTPNNGRSTRRR